MTRRWMVGATCAVAIACGGSDELASSLLADAGAVVVDAGQAIADAGAWFGDGGSAVAQDDAGSSTGTIVAQCSLTRTVQLVYGEPLIEHWASFDVDIGNVVQTWLCDATKEQHGVHCYADEGSTCTGDIVAQPECVQAGGMYAQSKYWVNCGDYSRVELIAR